MPSVGLPMKHSFGHSISRFLIATFPSPASVFSPLPVWLPRQPISVPRQPILFPGFCRQFQFPYFILLYHFPFLGQELRLLLSFKTDLFCLPFQIFQRDKPAFSCHGNPLTINRTKKNKSRRSPKMPRNRKWYYLADRRIDKNCTTNRRNQFALRSDLTKKPRPSSPNKYNNRPNLP